MDLRHGLIAERPVSAYRLVRTSTPGRRRTCLCAGNWLGDRQWVPIKKMLRKHRYDEQTIERVYEADVFPPVYDFEAWKNHRSRGRYLEHMISLARSYLLKDLSGPLTDVTVICLLVGTYQTLLEGGSLPPSWPNIAMSAPEPFHQTSFALSFMLVFRTNNSYARWLEARAAWGKIVNTCRDISRQAVAYFPESNSELRSALCRWTVAYARTSKLHLRENGSLSVAMQGVLKPFELKLLEQAGHRPLKALQVISEIVVAADVNDLVKQRMDTNLNTLENQIGICERIFKNPIPLSYTRHTARFLFTWLCFLPFDLWTKLGWGILPATLVISFFLLGIDEIAIQLEEPFGILPLENLCDTIQRNVYEILEKRQDVKGIVTAYKANTGAGNAPQGWAPPPRMMITTDDDDEIPSVADPYMRVQFESTDGISHTAARVAFADDDSLLPLVDDADAFKSFAEVMAAGQAPPVVVEVQGGLDAWGAEQKVTQEATPDEVRLTQLRGMGSGREILVHRTSSLDGSD